MATLLLHPAEVAKTSSNPGQVWPKPGRVWPTSANLENSGPSVAQSRGQIWPSRAVEIPKISTNPGQSWPEHGRDLVESTRVTTSPARWPQNWKQSQMLAQACFGSPACSGRAPPRMGAEGTTFAREASTVPHDSQPTPRAPPCCAQTVCRSPGSILRTARCDTPLNRRSPLLSCPHEPPQALRWRDVWPPWDSRPARRCSRHPLLFGSAAADPSRMTRLHRAWAAQSGSLTARLSPSSPSAPGSRRFANGSVHRRLANLNHRCFRNLLLAQDRMRVAEEEPTPAANRDLHCIHDGDDLAVRLG